VGAAFDQQWHIIAYCAVAESVVGCAHDTLDILNSQVGKGGCEAFLDLVNLHIFAELAHGSQRARR
jgi:hypothetical protein